jgi:hypothetical protein
MTVQSNTLNSEDRSLDGKAITLTEIGCNTAWARTQHTSIAALRGVRCFLMLFVLPKR